MENLMVFDEKEKKRLGTICIIPIVCFALCLIYYIALLLPLASGNNVPNSIAGITSANYNTMFMMLAASAIITAPIFIYCLVILARLKHLNAEHKVMWIIFLSILAPIASVFFYYLLVKKLPTYVGIHPTIA